jgi:dTDP-glucose 4,6-dehydratase
MDTATIKSELQWQPQETLESGLAKTVDWYLNHLDWIKAIERRPSFHQWLEHNYARRGEAQ